MESGNSIKIHSSEFEQLMMVDFFWWSFSKDYDLFPCDKVTPDGIVEAYGYMDFCDDYPYCQQFSTHVGDMLPRRFEYKGKFMEFQPSPNGIATLRDYDILLYCQCGLANDPPVKNRKNEIGELLEFDVEDFYAFFGRARKGDRDEALVQALERLKGSTIITNTVCMGHDTTGEPRGYISGYRLVRDETSKIKTVFVQLPYRLSLLFDESWFRYYHDGFTNLSPSRKAIYMFLKCYATQPENFVTASYEKVRQITGATSPIRIFKNLIEDLEENSIPGYAATVHRNEQRVTFKCISQAYRGDEQAE